MSHTKDAHEHTRVSQNPEDRRSSDASSSEQIPWNHADLALAPRQRPVASPANQSLRRIQAFEIAHGNPLRALSSDDQVVLVPGATTLSRRSGNPLVEQNTQCHTPIPLKLITKIWQSSSLRTLIARSNRSQRSLWLGPTLSLVHQPTPEARKCTKW